MQNENIQGWLPLEEKLTFQKELESLINSYSKENGSNTPDFILAEYLKDCLEIFNKAVYSREIWNGRKCKNIPPQFKNLESKDV